MTEGSARLGVLELLVCRFSVIEVLRFAIPNEHLQELVYLGQTYAAEKALSLGLLDEIMKAESLLERAKEVGQARVSSDGRQSSPANVNSANPLSSKLYDLTESRAPESWNNGARRKPAL